jgi:hypothetical protein
VLRKRNHAPMASGQHEESQTKEQKKETKPRQNIPIKPDLTKSESLNAIQPSETKKEKKNQ